LQVTPPNLDRDNDLLRRSYDPNSTERGVHYNLNDEYNHEHEDDEQEVETPVSQRQRQQERHPASSSSSSSVSSSYTASSYQRPSFPSHYRPQPTEETEHFNEQAEPGEDEEEDSDEEDDESTTTGESPPSSSLDSSDFTVIRYYQNYSIRGKNGKYLTAIPDDFIPVSYSSSSSSHLNGGLPDGYSPSAKSFEATKSPIPSSRSYLLGVDGQGIGELMDCLSFVPVDTNKSIEGLGGHTTSQELKYGSIVAIKSAYSKER
jgi:hypothetical protein